MSNRPRLRSRFSVLLAIIGALVVSALLFAACAQRPAGAPAAARTPVPTKAPEPTNTPAASASTPMTETTATTETTAMTTTIAMTTSGEEMAPAVMLYEDPTLGKILVDGKGMVLYVFDKDVKDKSNCSGDCLKNWPPLTVKDENVKPTAGTDVTAELAVIKRDDGTYQVTINGMPAYYYAKDTKADESSGQGVGDVWWVVAADGTKVTKK